MKASPLVKDQLNLWASRNIAPRDALEVILTIYGHYFGQKNDWLDRLHGDVVYVLSETTIDPVELWEVSGSPNYSGFEDDVEAFSVINSDSGYLGFAGFCQSIQTLLTCFVGICMAMGMDPLHTLDQMIDGGDG